MPDNLSSCTWAPRHPKPVILFRLSQSSRNRHLHWIRECLSRYFRSPSFKSCGGEQRPRDASYYPTNSRVPWQQSLASYSGRGSLLSWLRTTLVQRYRDHYRRTHREAPIDGFDCPAPELATPILNDLGMFTKGVAHVICELVAEDRFLLAAYFLDRQTLLQIARTLNVHEATISRRIKRLTLELHNRLVDQLHQGGLSKAAAEEALGVDPRDIEINLRVLLQSSRSKPFSEQIGGKQDQEPETR